MKNFHFLWLNTYFYCVFVSEAHSASHLTQPHPPSSAFYLSLSLLLCLSFLQAMMSIFHTKNIYIHHAIINCLGYVLKSICATRVFFVFIPCSISMLSWFSRTLCKRTELNENGLFRYFSLVHHFSTNIQSSFSGIQQPLYVCHRLSWFRLLIRYT